MERIVELSDIIVYREEMDKYKVTIEEITPVAAATEEVIDKTVFSAVSTESASDAN